MQSDLYKVGSFLEFLKQRNKEILNSCRQGDWQALPSDPSCALEVSTKGSYGPGCLMCRHLSHLTSFKERAIGSPFCIECGPEAGKEITIKSYGDIPPMSFRQERGMVLLPSYNLYVIASLALQELLPKHSYALRTAFICSGKGYTLSNHYQALTPWLQANLTPEVLISLCQQLVYILSEARKIDFIHGMPSLSSLHIDPRSCVFSCQGKKNKGAFTLRLEASERSSLSLGDQRVQSYRGWQRWDRHFTAYPYLMLREETMDMYEYYSSSPSYCGALDLYLFLLQLLTIPGVRGIVSSNPKLRQCFNPVWNLNPPLGNGLSSLLRVEIQRDLLDQTLSILWN